MTIPNWLRSHAIAVLGVATLAFVLVLAYNGSTIPEILAVLVVVVAAPLNWYVAIRLWLLSRSSPELRVLRAHAIAATALAIIVTVFALIFVNNGMQPPPLGTGETQLVTRGTLLVVSTLAAVYWLRLYRGRSR